MIIINTESLWVIKMIIINTESLWVTLGTMIGAIFGFILGWIYHKALLEEWGKIKRRK